MTSLRQRIKGPNAERRFLEQREKARARAIAHIERKRANDPQFQARLKLYTELVEAYGETCAICGNGPSGRKRLSIDHCHTTNEIRGLLCAPCNLMLGNAKDSVEILRKAIEFLSRDAYTGRDFAEARWNPFTPKEAS